ncbi:MAG TPA: hypothetical protein VNH38_00530, partial [Candidatus Dormibacteraeota bacterium]|nr:hypothetical protein [Candidatus Dormibacteraeota bacterium]
MWLGPIAALTVLTLVVAGCGSSGRHPVPSPTATATAPLPGLLGLAGEVAGPLLIAGPYGVAGTWKNGSATVESATIPATPTAAVTALAQALEVPGPPISTATGLGYNLGSNNGYQLTTDAAVDTFNFHPNAPTDEVGTTPTVAGADQFAENYLSADHVPADGGVIPIPQLSFSNGSDRTVYFQWSLDGLPVVNILGEPQEIHVDVATDQHQVTQLVGITGAIPYGAIGNPVVYPAMLPTQVVQYLNSGTIKPAKYLLSPSGQPFPAPSPAVAGPVTLSAAKRGVVDSFGTSVPVYIFQVTGDPSASQFVTCAVPPAGCVPLRFSVPTPSPGSAATPTPLTLTGTQTLGSSGSGYQVQGIQYGVHGSQFWVVFHFSGGSGVPQI